jgi:hypothetical protein
MNDFKKLLPRKKSNKKRSSSAKRSNSLTEENKSKKIMNSERYFTTYNEVFEKINSKIYKSGKYKANSASKKRKNSLSKNKKKKSIDKKNLRNILTNNTNCTTQDTDNNKIKYIKLSPKKEEFNKILDKAKDLLSIQSDLVLQCGKLSQNLSKSDLDINEKMKNEINDNGSNTLPGLAKALYLLECKKDNKPINYGMSSNNFNYKQNYNGQIDNSFYIKTLNELNGFIGELGYSYVYNEFKESNYKKENILIYFSNIQKLINILHQTINEQKELLLKQSNQINQYEKYIQDFQYNNIENIENNITSKNENQNILINDNENNNQSSNNTFFNNTSSQEFAKLQDCTNIFKNNYNTSQKNNTHFNSYINNNDTYNNKNMNVNESLENNYNEFDEQNLPPEMSNNYLNYYKNQNQNIISSMINSTSFFESYKRNKELKHNLNYNYNEKNVNNE